MSPDLIEIERDYISFQVCEKEYDSQELAELNDWFKASGWTTTECSWSVVGSQEITICEVKMGAHAVYLVFETYQGVKLYAKPENESLFNEIKLST